MTKVDKEGGFISHLTELRQRLIHSFIFLFIFFIGCYFFSEHIYGFLVEPYAKAVKDSEIERRLIFTALQETFLTYLKVSFFAAFFLTCPYILVQIWKFIAPGLYKHEKIAIVPYLILTPVNSTKSFISCKTLTLLPVPKLNSLQIFNDFFLAKIQFNAAR